MNSIARKVLVALALVFALYTATMYSLMKFVVLPSFVELQKAAVDEEVSRCRLILNKETAVVGTLCADWSAWDDACKFIADRNEAFIRSALDPEVMKNTNISTAIFMDTSGNIVWGKTYDWTIGKEIAVPEFSPESIRKTPVFYSYAGVDSALTGLMRVGERVAIVSARPIVSSRKELPIKGALLMGRFIDKSDVKAMAEGLGTHFELVLAESIPAGVIQERRSSNRDRVTSITMVNDIFGKPSLAIVAEVPTPIVAKGVWVNRLVSSSVVAAGIITLIVTFILLKGMILRRLDQLADILRKAAGAASQAQNPTCDSDELGRHTQMVMQMLSRLDITEQALGASDQRFAEAVMNAPFPAMIHDESGRTILVNRQWVQSTGYEWRDIPTVEDWCRKAHGANASAVLTATWAVYGAEGRQDMTGLAVRKKDGHGLVWDIRSSVIGKASDGTRQALTMAIDATEVRSMTQRMGDNESLFRILSESIPAVTYLAEVTHEARLIYVSPQVIHFFGINPETIRKSGAPWKIILLPGEYEDITERRFRAVSQNEHFTAEYQALGRDGETILLREEAQLVSTMKGPMIQGVIFAVTGTMTYDARVGIRQAGH